MKKNYISKNKKLKYNYIFKKEYIAGLALKGDEVNNIRKQSLDLSKLYIIIKFGELYLNDFKTNTSLNSYKRNLKLLLKKHEINFIKNIVLKSSYSILPYILFWSKGLVKLKIVIAKGKKKIDKRLSIMKKEEYIINQRFND